LKTVEIASIVAIAVALLVGGSSILWQLAHLRGYALVVLGALALAQIFAMTRRRRTATGQLQVARDIAFLAATLVALTYVTSPARWALGASIAAAEFGLLLELLARVGPQGEAT